MSADNILTAPKERFMQNFAVVAWVTEVSVLRGDKFLGKKSLTMQKDAIFPEQQVFICMQQITC